MSGTDPRPPQWFTKRPLGIEHIRIPEIAVLDGQTELDEDVLRDGDGFHASGHDLERGGLQDDLGVGLVKRLGVGSRRLEEGGELLLPPPDHERPPHELGLRREDQPHVVAGIDAPAVTRLSQVVVEKLGERDRPIEIVLQHRSRHRRIEPKILGESRRRPEEDGREKTDGPEIVGGIPALVHHDVPRLLRKDEVSRTPCNAAGPACQSNAPGASNAAFAHNDAGDPRVNRPDRARP